MSHYIITKAGGSVLDFTTPDKVTLTRDGTVEYEHVDAATPPPDGGTAPANAIQIAAPIPGGTATLTYTKANQVYFFVLPNPVGNVAVTKGPGNPSTYHLNSGISTPANAGNWALLKTIPMQQTAFFPHGTVYPYYKYQSTESGGLGWTSVDQGKGVAVAATGDVYSFSTDLDAILDIQVKQ